jgi:hypothetical protein
MYVFVELFKRMLFGIYLDTDVSQGSTARRETLPNPAVHESVEREGPSSESNLLGCMELTLS